MEQIGYIGPLVSFIIILQLYTVPQVNSTSTYEEKARLELFKYNTDLLDFTTQERTVFITILIRNKEKALPYFFKAIEDLDYDRKRIILWITSDHNTDNSVELIHEWVENVKQLYHRVEMHTNTTLSLYTSQKNDLDWPIKRHEYILQLRQQALDKAREYWADYILFVDADNILMNPYTLRHLIDKQKTIVAPMLETTASYSNYWCGMDENGYYVRTDQYFKIKKREISGTFSVPMIHSTYLIDLTTVESKLIQFWPIPQSYKLQVDDIIVFAVNLKKAGINMYIDNSNVYGYMPIPVSSDTATLKDEEQSFIFTMMEAFTEPPVGIGIYMKASNYVTMKARPRQKLGFDEIYMINLERRLDRRTRMKTAFDLLDIDYKWFKAIDSSSLNTSYLQQMGIDMMPGYVDPYRERALTRGEIGCFLSHYFIWEEIISRGYDKVLVMEDDIRFENSFTKQLQNVMLDVERLQLDWDLIYVGRKRMQLETPEKYVSDLLVEADYSYWTLAYIISNSGAKKLIDGKPLGKMVPVDEYIPIMFDKHPIDLYGNFFPKRDLKAFSVNPLLVFPTHYTGQENYFSDTETSSIWEEVADKAGTHEEYNERINKSKQPKNEL